MKKSGLKHSAYDFLRSFLLLRAKCERKKNMRDVYNFFLNASFLESKNFDFKKGTNNHVKANSLIVKGSRIEMFRMCVFRREKFCHERGKGKKIEN